MSADRHPATAAVWDWLENGEGKDKPEAIRRAARKRVEEIDCAFLEWDADRQPRKDDE